MTSRPTAESRLRWRSEGPGSPRRLSSNEPSPNARLVRAEGPVEPSLGRKPQVLDEKTNPLSPEGATAFAPAWRHVQCRRGSALLFALVILAVASSIGAVAVTTAVVGDNVVRNDLFREKAYCIAESGVEKALVELLRDPHFAGDTDVAFDLGSFSTTLRPLRANEWEITSIGTVRKGDVPFLRQRIVARVTLDAGRARVISWRVSSLPVERSPVTGD